MEAIPDPGFSMLPTLGGLALAIVLFCGFCTCAFDWPRVWPVLARGGWVPLLLVVGMAVAVWALVWPGEMTIPGFWPIRNGYWQAGIAGLTLLLAFGCGRLQDACGWRPNEVSLDEPAPAEPGAVHGH